MTTPAAAPPSVPVTKDVGVDKKSYTEEESANDILCFCVFVFLVAVCLKTIVKRGAHDI